jgi:hypothetical protein
MKRRIWQFLFFAVLAPAFWCVAQDPLPQREESPSPNASASPPPNSAITPTPTPIPQNILGLIPPPAAAPSPSAAPVMPDLSQLDQVFKQPLPGKEASEHRAHLEWRALKNRTVNDPDIVAAKAAAESATTDLEKRNRLRIYYETLYGRMSAKASTPEMVTYLKAVKKAYLDLIDQPRVRPSPGSDVTAASSPGAQPTPISSVTPGPGTDTILPNE